MTPPPEVQEAIGWWQSLTRWERAELGRRLRQAGWIYGEMMEALPVGKGILAGWCKGIRLTETQIIGIKTRRPPGVRTGIPVDTHRKRREATERIRTQGALELPLLLRTQRFYHEDPD
jgi:hypothetical protein